MYKNYKSLESFVMTESRISVLSAKMPNIQGEYVICTIYGTFRMSRSTEIILTVQYKCQ